MPIRKRLLGFAFAASDLLIELSSDGRVAMALGSGPTATVGIDVLQDQIFWDHLGKASGKALRSALSALQAGGRFGPVEILMTCGEGQVRRGILRAFMLPELAPNVSCSITYEGPAFQLFATDGASILTPAAFLTRTRDVLTDADRVGELSLSFIDVGGLDQPGETAERVTAKVEARLRAASVDGATAARLTPERYALLRPSDDGRDLESEVRQVGDDEGLSLAVRGARTVICSDDPLNALRALRFAVEGCLKEGGLENPQIAFDTALSRTLREAEGFRTMVRDRNFVLHYQPIVDLDTGAVHHFEALSRFLNQASPADTIHMAEELALIEGFDLAVAEKAIRRLRQPGAGLMKFAINVSGASLAGDHYVESLLRMTASCPDVRRRLIVEVTESAAVADTEAANRRLSALRKTGIKLCIDDFGAGAASYDYIRSLSVDTVKIDGRLIKGLENDPKSRTVVSHLVELCASLKLTTIAEMVETQSCADTLKFLGVDYAQGWLFGKAEAEPRTTLAKPASARRRGAVEAWG